MSSSTQNDALTLTAASETKAVVFNKAITATFNATVAAPSIENETHDNRKPVDMVCVIDRSGSMSGEPMNLVREALSFMVSQLKTGDKLSLVTFGDDARLVFGLTDMTEDGKQEALKQIRGLAADGWTNLSSGITMGVDELKKRTGAASSSSVASVLVFTDGQANHGVTGIPELVQLTVNSIDGISGPVSLHTFGFSQNHNPELLTKLAEAANGVFYYIPNVEKIPEVFADCLGALLSVVAMNVELEVTVDLPGASLGAIHTPFAIKQLTQNQHISINLGQMYSEQSRDILFDVNLPASDAADPDCKVLRFRLTHLNRAEQSVETSAFATIERTTEGSPDVLIVNEAVAKQKARIVTANAMKEALAHKARGDVHAAQESIRSAKSKVSSHAGYISQLDEAEDQVAQTNDGYLWTTMRSHMAQQSSAAAPVSASNDIGYSNAVQKKMRAAVSKHA